MKVSQTYFDAQGRPVGKISLDGQTREFEFTPRDPKGKPRTWTYSAAMMRDLRELYGGPKP